MSRMSDMEGSCNQNVGVGGEEATKSPAAAKRAGSSFSGPCSCQLGGWVTRPVIT
jgi:hypothetical protein